MLRRYAGFPNVFVCDKNSLEEDLQRALYGMDNLDSYTLNAPSKVALSTVAEVMKSGVGICDVSLRSARMQSYRAFRIHYRALVTKVIVSILYTGRSLHSGCSVERLQSVNDNVRKALLSGRYNNLTKAAQLVALKLKVPRGKGEIKQVFVSANKDYALVWTSINLSQDVVLTTRSSTVSWNSLRKQAPRLPYVFAVQSLVVSTGELVNLRHNIMDALIKTAYEEVCKSSADGVKPSEAIDALAVILAL